MDAGLLYVCMLGSFESRRGVVEYLFDFADEAEMLTHCAPIFFLPRSASLPTSIRTNGTAALIDTGIRRILVTCEHVWSEFLKFRLEYSEARLATVFRYGHGSPQGVWLAVKESQQAEGKRNR